MKLLIQRVSKANVSVNDEIVSSIEHGLLCFLGIAKEDASQDQEWLIKKLIGLRLFSDAHDKMNLSISDVEGELLLVSQFTLMANCKKGTRPSFGDAMAPLEANKHYLSFVERLRSQTCVSVKTGVFGADMKIDLLNDGPVTIMLDSKENEVF